MEGKRKHKKFISNHDKKTDTNSGEEGDCT